MTRGLCILVHGFTGNPWEILPLADALTGAGYDVLAPLLPGHYAIKQRMKNAHAAQWIAAIEGLTEDALKARRTVHLIGFSMGAMIAAILGRRHGVRSLVLLSPAVFVVTPSVLVTRTKNAVKLIRDDPSSLRKTLQTNLHGLRSASFYNLLQFQKIVREAKAAMPHIRVPICILHGQQDEIADPKSARWIYRSVSSHEREIHILEHSGHVVCHDRDADFLNRTVISFLQKCDTTP